MGVAAVNRKHIMKKNLNFRASNGLVEKAVTLACLADSDGCVKTADTIDRALTRLAQGHGQTGRSQQTDQLYAIIKQLNTHYSAQFKIVAMQLQQIRARANGHPGTESSGEAEGGKNPQADPNFPQLNIAPGAQMALDAQNADTITVNTI